jgi:uncharacterized protein (DUF58 family)
VAAAQGSPTTAAARTGQSGVFKLEGEAHGLADRLPDLILDALHVANTVAHGIHGRRRAGTGETFWQFRQFQASDPATVIDWRRSASSDHLYVREREWEAAHTFWLWADLSVSMDFHSRLSTVSKRQRAIVLLLALAESLSTSGERIGLLGVTNTILARNGAERLATSLPDAATMPALPETHSLKRFSDVALFGDFLDPIDKIEETLDAIVKVGARAHLVQIVDPIEETFPYAGRTEFLDPETGVRHVVSRAEQYRDDYHARITALRDRLTTLCRRLDWTFIIHRTDRPATEPLLALYARVADRQNNLGVFLAGRAA